MVDLRGQPQDLRPHPHTPHRPRLDLRTCLISSLNKNLRLYRLCLSDYVSETPALGLLLIIIRLIVKGEDVASRWSNKEALSILSLTFFLYVV